jgi:hypothetical protein
MDGAVTDGLGAIRAGAAFFCAATRTERGVTDLSRTHFILSPASCSGKRAGLLLRQEAEFDLAVRFHRNGAPLGEVFSFLSGLYFRGKLTYALRFAGSARGGRTILVVTPDRGLVDPAETIGPPELESFARTPIELGNPVYRLPLERDVERLAAEMGAADRVVLLGSVATPKYVEPLLERLEDRLCFPEPFVGMGDMQRGALMLRAVEAGSELPYIRAAGAVRSRAARPARGRS